MPNAAHAMSTSIESSYFIKEILSNAIRLPSGRKVPWEPVGDDVGVLATNDPQLISELETASRRGVGGVRQVDLRGYEDAKKKSTAEELRKVSLFRANNQFRTPRLSEDVAPAVEVKPLPRVSPSGQPIATPSTLPLPTPKSRRRSILTQPEPAAPTP